MGEGKEFPPAIAANPVVSRGVMLSIFLFGDLNEVGEFKGELGLLSFCDKFNEIEELI